MNRKNIRGEDCYPWYPYCNWYPYYPWHPWYSYDDYDYDYYYDYDYDYYYDDYYRNNEVNLELNQSIPDTNVKLRNLSKGPKPHMTSRQPFSSHLPPPPPMPSRRALQQPRMKIPRRPRSLPRFM